MNTQNGRYDNKDINIIYEKERDFRLMLTEIIFDYESAEITGHHLKNPARAINGLGPTILDP